MIERMMPGRAEFYAVPNSQVDPNSLPRRICKSRRILFQAEFS
jgi:hypothetical protein